MNQPNRALLCLPLLCLASACAHDRDGAAAPVEWESLFDGETTAGWRGYRQEDCPDGWQVVDGALTRVAPAGDIISEGTYDSFVLEFEWKVSEHANSGVFFHVSEDRGAVYETGPEYQILDDVGYGEVDPLHSAAANYALHAPHDKSLAPVGEWNTARLVVDGPRVEHWLNGKRVVSYDLWSPDWEARVAASKFGDMPGYGRNTSGHLALQDHGHWVAYRNLRIRRL